MKIYVDKLPENCLKCDLIQSETIEYFENYSSRERDYCPIDGETIFDSYVRHEKCPLIELKPKELEWSFDGEIHTAKIFGDIEISFAQFINGKSKIYIGDREYCESYDKRNSELKKMCEEINNKLFAEMIGG